MIKNISIVITQNRFMWLKYKNIIPDEFDVTVMDLHVCIFVSGIHVPSGEHTAVVTFLQLSCSSDPKVVATAHTVLSYMPASGSCHRDFSNYNFPAKRPLERKPLKLQN